MDVIEKDQLRLKLPFSLTAAGPSSCGKTLFVLNLVKARNEMIDGEFSSIYYCYGVYQEQVKEFESLGAICVPGFPSNVEADGGNVLCIFDDLMLANTKELARFFTHMRHVNMSTIFLTQSLYFDDKYLRLVARNSTYLVLFRCPRDASIPQILGRQMYPENPSFLPAAFSRATAAPYQPLFLDLRAGTPEHLRIRQGILPCEHKYIFLPCCNKNHGKASQARS